MEFKIKATPRASETRLEDYVEGTLRMRVKAVPQKGEANTEIVAYFSKLFRVAKSKIHIESGHTSRIKKVSIEGLSKEDFEKVIAREVQKKK